MKKNIGSTLALYPMPITVIDKCLSVKENYKKEKTNE